jgi:DNA-binding transcriptional LysR family regulator
MLSLSGLQALVAVIEEESFTKAAERLNATQSGVSQQIAKLEGALDVVLLRRGPPRGAPPPARPPRYPKTDGGGVEK